MRERLTHGKLDALVNNAGISPKGKTGARLTTLTTPLDVWQQVFEVNFFAPIRLARGLILAMKTSAARSTWASSPTSVRPRG